MLQNYGFRSFKNKKKQVQMTYYYNLLEESMFGTKSIDE